MTHSLFGDEPSTEQAYRVLARKYRPSVFADLIGQEVLVRTLTNAIATGRIAHAFLLTGIRGIGKTTTARIIARGLNCVGADEKGGPTISPCGVCHNCQMIVEDRHMDVIEMDAASRTGVGDIRELIETVHYLPTTARYKVYIIDEVHMLSTNAFNALLKTLEEPPPHVKFIFATTEIRKIPVTILSRCQRFDLKRVDVETLSAHLQTICEKESIEAEDEALQIIANAAEGSVRDALSMLDQAIAHAATEGTDSLIRASIVRSMLGMLDKSQNFDLLEALFGGKTQDAITLLGGMYAGGADPTLVLQDLLEITHYIMRTKIAGESISDVEYAENDRKKAAMLASNLSVATLGRAWQMLLKGLNEARIAPNPLQAVEMIMIRLTYAADLPSPAELAKTLQTVAQNPSVATINSPVSRPVSGGAPATSYSSTSSGNLALSTTAVSAPGPALTLAVSNPAIMLESFEDVVALFARQREAMLHNYLKNECALVSFAEGRIEVNPSARVPADFTTKASKLLSQWTQNRWAVVTSDSAGIAPLGEQEKARIAQELKDMASHPEVKPILEVFPGATVTSIKNQE